MCFFFNCKPGRNDRESSKTVLSMTTDNRKWQYGHPNRKFLYLWKCYTYCRNFNGKPGFSTTAKWKTLFTGDCNNRNIYWNGTVLLLISSVGSWEAETAACNDCISRYWYRRWAAGRTARDRVSWHDRGMGYSACL